MQSIQVAALGSILDSHTIEIYTLFPLETLIFFIPVNKFIGEEIQRPPPVALPIVLPCTFIQEIKS